MTIALICFLTAVIVEAVVIIHYHIKLKACEGALFDIALAIAKHEIIDGCKVDVEGVEIHHYKE